MVRCLVTKLLLELQRRHPTKAASLKFANEGLPTDALAYGDTESLCLLFRHVNAQFPPQATIYCVIDGVFCYEKPEMVRNACLLVRRLVDLVRRLFDPVESQRSAGPVVIVLFREPLLLVG
ncbi:hypothetical protein F4821DRAFT_172364 [Hypoxylon rubiginosum]|uniref:Uncharacterized protein n=1 Tax=Hypoxylon rubiginosum TaxID=110542 RepID=A0ACC0DGB1_9PEZI|nr:hypothetical protein F4821DRAFT_172364 [Hypoxylon rubiginosum]